MKIKIMKKLSILLLILMPAMTFGQMKALLMQQTLNDSPEHIGYSSGFGTSTSGVVGTHANTQVGDLMVIFASFKTGAANTPSGWIKMHAVGGGSSTYPGIYLYYRIATVGDLGVNTTVSFTATTAFNIVKQTIRTRTSSPWFDVIDGSNYFFSISASSIALFLFSTDKTNSMICSFCAVNGNSSIIYSAGWLGGGGISGSTFSTRVIYDIQPIIGQTRSLSYGLGSSLPVQAVIFEIYGYD